MSISWPETRSPTSVQPRRTHIERPWSVTDQKQRGRGAVRSSLGALDAEVSSVNSSSPVTRSLTCRSSRPRRRIALFGVISTAPLGYRDLSMRLREGTLPP